MADERRIVWVIGAGFSKPLGGPLLAGLFSRTSIGDLDTRYPNFVALRDEHAKRVRWLYDYGSGLAVSYQKADEDGRAQGENLWTNAEDFVDYLDTAAEPTGKDERGNEIARPHFDRLAKVFENYHSPPVPQFDDLRTAARRLIAAECCGFLKGG